MHKIIIYLSILLLVACETGGGMREQTTIEELDRWRAIADSAYAKGQFKRARNHYLKISVAVPQDAEIWFRLGNVYNRLEDSENALSAYKEALVRDNTYSKAWYNRSMIQLKVAAQSFQEAVRHLKSDDPVYIASIKTSEALLAIINDSNKTIAAGYKASKGPVLATDSVEVIILKQSDKHEPNELDDQKTPDLKQE